METIQNIGLIQKFFPGNNTGGFFSSLIHGVLPILKVKFSLFSAKEATAMKKIIFIPAVILAAAVILSGCVVDRVVERRIYFGYDTPREQKKAEQGNQNQNDQYQNNQNNPDDQNNQGVNQDDGAMYYAGNGNDSTDTNGQPIIVQDYYYASPYIPGYDVPWWDPYYAGYCYQPWGIYLNFGFGYRHHFGDFWCSPFVPVWYGGYDYFASPWFPPFYDYWGYNYYDSYFWNGHRPYLVDGHSGSGYSHYRSVRTFGPHRGGLANGDPASYNGSRGIDRTGSGTSTGFGTYGSGSAVGRSGGTNESGSRSGGSYRGSSEGSRSGGSSGGGSRGFSGSGSHRGRTDEAISNTGNPVSGGSRALPNNGNSANGTSVESGKSVNNTQSSGSSVERANVGTVQATETPVENHEASRITNTRADNPTPAPDPVRTTDSRSTTNDNSSTTRETPTYQAPRNDGNSSAPTRTSDPVRSSGGSSGSSGGRGGRGTTSFNQGKMNNANQNYATQTNGSKTVRRGRIYSSMQSYSRGTGSQGRVRVNNNNSNSSSYNGSYSRGGSGTIGSGYSSGRSNSSSGSSSRGSGSSGSGSSHGSSGGGGGRSSKR
jgi:hypothetical protein